MYTVKMSDSYSAFQGRRSVAYNRDNRSNTTGEYAANGNAPNPFQRNNDRYQNRSYRDQGYHSWKNKTDAPPSLKQKEKVLTADDFPALPGSSTRPTTIKEKPENSFVDRVKDMITKEEQRRLQEENEKEEEKLDVIPLSSWMQKRNQAKKQQEMERRMEEEEYERNYRYQVSNKMEPPEDDY